MIYRWDKNECVTAQSGRLVGCVWEIDGGRWRGKREGKVETFLTKQQAMEGVENSYIYTAENPQEHSKVKEIMQDIKSFIHDNRNLVYWIALAFVADHFFFGGKFRERLHGMVDKLIGKAEAKIEASK